MDKNTIIGVVLIFAILIGFSYLNKPSQEQIEAAKRKKDSLELVEAAKIAQAKEQANVLGAQAIVSQEQPVAHDSASAVNEAVAKYGVFGAAATGEEEFITLENNLMKITLSTKGGKIYSVELKGYQTYDSLPLILFEGDANLFGLNFFSKNRSIQTDELFFQPSVSQKAIEITGPAVKKGKEGNEKYNENNPGESKSIVMKLNAGEGKYLEFSYGLKHNSYMVDFDVKTVGLNQLLPQNTNYLNFNWSYDTKRLERKSKFGEDRYTTINYKYFEDDVDKLKPSKSSEESLKTKVRWISFRQLFFSSTIIANDAFPTADIKYNYQEENEKSLGNFYADIALPYEGKQTESYGMRFFFGPNHYNTLKQYDLSMESFVDLGYFRFINTWLVIPVFNFLRRFIDSFGLIILLLTIFIKMLLLPLTYKSYISQAKMKALKPEIDELTEKYGKDKAMEKQQATMALYKKAGVNPMGGCLPMLLQFPILISMFFFFPTSIELRQESFLWATDLSTYDSIFSLPFDIPFYGSHVSLFCLLMTVTTIISTKMNSQATSSQQMPGMQTMMYIMPVMFLFILNNYSAGLSYYYFLANLITIGQMFLFRKLINEDKIRAQLQAKQKKGGPAKKSNFQKRLEQMAKDKGMQLPK